MKKDNIFITICYESIKGGTNNLQIAHVVRPSLFGSGMVDIIKTFTSQRMKAQNRAKKWLQNNK